MKFFEIIEGLRQAFESMRSNKLRSFLASLGVVIGISFVILMGWVVSGLDKAFEDTVNTIGQDIIYVDKWDWSGGKKWRDAMARRDISLLQANELCSRVTQAEEAVPITGRFGSVLQYKNDKFDGVMVRGTYSNYSKFTGGQIAEGRFFSPVEDRVSAGVIILGFKVNTTIFPDGDGLGKTLKIRGKSFLVIGTLKKQGTMLMDFLDNQVYIPLNSFLEIYGATGRSVSIALKAGSLDQMDNVREEARGLMREVRNLKPHQEDDFSLNETKAFQSTIDTIRVYIWGIGIGMTILSFIVGIIGIMNIMYVSVAERTKEIGIRKAIGAKRRSILLQFIVESSALCLTGAIAAFIGCSILIFAIGTILPKMVPETSFLSPYMPYQFLIVASAVSIFVGLLAGLLPALRAANLDPVDALRFE